MNRALIFGIALFVAVVGVAMISMDTDAVAGHKKCKCSQDDCCAPSCCAPAPACCAPVECAPAPACGCHGAAAAAVAPANPVAQRSQFGFRTVSFQR